MLPYLLTNIFEVQKYYQNGHKFNGVYSRNNLPKIKDGSYIIFSWWGWINRNSLNCIVCECWKCNILC